jgi:predicted permease
MLFNYIKIAFRNLSRNIGFSLINILGLSLGMTVAMLIGLWLHDEVSYNTYHQNHSRIAQVWTSFHNDKEVGSGTAVSVPLGLELRAKYAADFKNVALTSWNFSHVMSVGDKQIATKGMWVQPEFPKMFTLKMVRGSQDALNDPSAILLNESLAQSFFGDEDPVNKTIRMDNTTDFKVAGVYEDLPKNSTFHETSLLIPWEKYLAIENWVKESQTQWNNHSFQLYVEMQPQADFEKTTGKIKGIAMQHLKANTDGIESAFLHPMDKWHLYSEFKNGVNTGGRIQFVWMFGIIGVFVLLLACINFMNLATARSEKRAKEVGIRKSIGSVKSQLVFQFLSESLLMVLLSFVLAFLLLLLSLPWFNDLADKRIQIQWLNPVFWLLIITFTLFTGLISGSYPAFYLSSFEPIKVLKGTFRVGKLAAVPRKVLVILQFTVSITLIIGTVVVFRQIQHAKNRPVGYDREGLITIPLTTPDLNGKYAPLREELLKTGAVQNMAQSSSPITEIWANQIGFDWEGKAKDWIPAFGTVAVTHDFGKTVDWKIKEGRDFSREFGTDTSGLIFNEAALKLTGIKNPIGKTIRWNDQPYQIIGIVKDLIMESPFDPIKPTIFTLSYTWAGAITVRLKPGVPVRDALAKVEPVFRKFNPSSPFQFDFTDEQYAQKFSAENRIGTLASVFAGLAILISCLGLFGLASFTAEQRTKEIGIRKVLGASVFNLWELLSRDFVKLVIISFVIAAPIAWYFMSQWLQDYNYRSEISWWIFAVAGFGALVVTLLTVSFQAIKAALANPVKSLRSE